MNKVPSVGSTIKKNPQLEIDNSLKLSKTFAQYCIYYLTNRQISLPACAFESHNKIICSSAVFEAMSPYFLEKTAVGSRVLYITGPQRSSHCTCRRRTFVSVDYCCSTAFDPHWSQKIFCSQAVLTFKIAQMEYMFFMIKITRRFVYIARGSVVQAQVKVRNSNADFQGWSKNIPSSTINSKDWPSIIYL